MSWYCSYFGLFPSFTIWEENKRCRAFSFVPVNFTRRHKPAASTNFRNWLRAFFFNFFGGGLSWAEPRKENVYVLFFFILFKPSLLFRVCLPSLYIRLWPTQYEYEYGKEKEFACACVSFWRFSFVSCLSPFFVYLVVIQAVWVSMAKKKSMHVQLFLLEDSLLFRVSLPS